MKKLIFTLGLLGLIIFSGLYAKRKFYDPKHRLETAKEAEGYIEIVVQLQQITVFFGKTLQLHLILKFQQMQQSIILPCKMDIQEQQISQLQSII